MVVIEPLSFALGIGFTLAVIKLVKAYKEAPTDEDEGGVERGSHLTRK